MRKLIMILCTVCSTFLSHVQKNTIEETSLNKSQFIEYFVGFNNIHPVAKQLGRIAAQQARIMITEGKRYIERLPHVCIHDLSTTTHPKTLRLHVTGLHI